MGGCEGFRLEGNPFPNCSTSCLEELRKQIKAAIRQREIGSIIVEPIQGRGGDIVPPRDFLRMLRHICDEEKLLLIVDEIYTGLNRTGKLFACDQFDIAPDIICLAKALSGGFPNLRVYRPGGYHGCVAAIKRRSLAYQHDAWKSSRLRHEPWRQSPSTSKRRRDSSLEEPGRCFDDRCSP